MNDTEIMLRVVELSREGVLGGHGGPFGCVVVKDGVIVSEAHNEVLSSKDPTAHAELLAIRRASATLGSFDLSACEVYTNGAPCCMCMSSMLWARVKRAYYILGMADSAAIGLGDTAFYDELSLPLESRRIVPLEQRPLLSDAARAVYHLWRDKPDRVDF
jgi:tRNA(Arg) A34 adenosine deaminase TadA